jgi:hypothetical protein
MAHNQPAFPQNDFSAYTDDRSGMTLRDYFAGQALNGLCSNPAMFDGSGTLTQVRAQESWVVEVASTLADAMLVERAKGGEA